MDEKEFKEKSAVILDKVKELVKEGNVTKVRLVRNGETLISLPVNVGLIGAVIGLHAAPIAILGAGIAAYGLNCRIEIVKKDGSVVTVTKEVPEEPAEEAEEAAEEAPEEAPVEEEPAEEE